MEANKKSIFKRKKEKKKSRQRKDWGWLALKMQAISICSLKCNDAWKIVGRARFPCPLTMHTLIVIRLLFYFFKVQDPVRRIAITWEWPSLLQAGDFQTTWSAPMPAIEDVPPRLPAFICHQLLVFQSALCRLDAIPASDPPIADLPLPTSCLLRYVIEPYDQQRTTPSYCK